MYSTLTLSRKTRYTHPHESDRREELAHMLVRAFGYQGAMDTALASRWDEVASTIRFLKGQSIGRY